MRIGLIPDGTRERLILRRRRFPLPLFDVMGTMLLSRTVMAGVRFGLFDRLAEGPKTAATLAREAGCDRHGTELLLDALVACGYLEQDNDHYRNSPLSSRWLLSESSSTLANFVRYNYEQWEWFSQLEDYVEHGRAQDIHGRLDQTQMWRSYMLGLRDLAALSGEELVGKIKADAPRSLLDVGGGHGYFSMAMCRRHPTLRATVLDLEPAVRIGQELVAQAGMNDRVEFRAGPLVETPFGENHDLAFLFNIVHHLQEETCRATLRRLHTALAPSGTLAVWEPFREERKRKQNDQLGSLLALFFGVTSARQTYQFAQVAAWAREAGFKKIRRQRLRTAPFAALLLATK
jgi:2-polyprenyl-3-methyl-5-hydroxy-6-metoxy-1,4-benzoquinol methylase